ncbi:MAG: ankyrin repeat domain-containing protein [Treponema sp.]|nr:ankyrin repeat domain-containing protein [Treponema sp.]
MRKINAFLFSLILVFGVTACKSSEAAPEEKLTPHELIKENRIEDAQNQFKTPYDINDTDEDGNTVLHLAARLKDPKVAEYFILKGADTEIVNKKGNTALHEAILSNNYAVAEVLTKMGADVFATGVIENKKTYTNENGEIVEDIHPVYKRALEMGLESKTNSQDYENLFITPENGKREIEYGQNMVHYFVQRQNEHAIGLCISKGLDLSVRDDNGKTPLDLAFEEIDDLKSVNIAALLIKGGAEQVETEFSYFQDAVSSYNMDMRFEDNQTPLHMASAMGHLAIAEYLLINGADPNLQDSSGSTPLHEAVRYGNIDVIKMLVNGNVKNKNDFHCNVNALNNLGKSPIMVIMPKDKMEEIYDILIEQGADLNIKDSFGDTLLHTATMMHAPSTILSKLVEGGADVNVKNKEGVTPFEIAIQHNSREMTKFYAEHDADIHTKDTHGISPLSLALEAERDLFEMIISKKNAQSQNSEGNTPLHVALLNNASMEKILYIISLTDDVNIRNSDGNNVLYIACEKRQESVVKAILEKGGDIFSINKDSYSPLRLALRDGGKLQDWIITSRTIKTTDGLGNTVLHYAAEWQYSNAIISLVEKGADPLARNANGENICFSASKTDNPEILNTVIKVGAHVNERDYLGNTPLHMAVKFEANKSIARLLELGIDINAQNTSGKSALAVAAFSGKYPTAEFLLKNGADVNTSDVEGTTILMDAIKGQNKTLISLLLSYDAKPYIKDISGVSSYHKAAETGNIEIINIIRNLGGDPLGRDRDGNTPFSIVMKRDIKVIKAVLGDNTGITDSDGNNPIHIAIKSKASDKLLNELIKMGYPIDGRNADGYTPLVYAVEGNDVNRALTLLKNKANPFQSINKKGENAVSIALSANPYNQTMIANIVHYAGKASDIQGNTILHYAAKTSNKEIVQDILSYGLPKNVKNVQGDTPFDLARRWGNKEIAELLK